MKNLNKKIILSALTIGILFQSSLGFADPYVDGKFIKPKSIDLLTKPVNILPILNGGTGSSTLNSDIVPEGDTNFYYHASLFNIDFSAKTTDDLAQGDDNKYFSNSLARGAFSASLPLGYSSSTGVFSIQVADGTHDGYLSSSAYNTFSNKQSAITTGTVSQYLRGDLSLATFPTTLSSFSNDTNYVNQTALDLKADLISPSFTTPNLGLATANKLDITGIDNFGDPLLKIIAPEGITPGEPTAIIDNQSGGTVNLLRINAGDSNDSGYALQINGNGELLSLLGDGTFALKNNTLEVTATGAQIQGTNTGDNATNSQYSGLEASKQDTLGYTAENTANKDTDSTFAANSDTKYPSQKAVKTALDLKANLASPSFTTPNIGVAVATTVNGMYENKQMSIDNDGSGYKLVNDTTSPNNYSYYGTNGSGTKGFYNNEPYIIGGTTAIGIYTDSLSVIPTGNTTNIILNSAFTVSVASAEKYLSGTPQGINATSLVTSATNVSDMVVNGYLYALVIKTSATASASIWRVPITSDIGTAGNWTQLTISGTALGVVSTDTFAGYTQSTGKFWVIKSGVGLIPYTLSGTTLTSSSTITVTGAVSTYANARVNNIGIYAPFTAAPQARFADFTGALDGRQIGVAQLSTSRYVLPNSFYITDSATATYMAKVGF